MLIPLKRNVRIDYSRAMSPNRHSLAKPCRSPPILVLIAVLSGLCPAAAEAQTQAADRIAAGRALLEESCARCHSIEQTGASPFEPAPPFRTLGARYPLENLEEALAEGILGGHPAMPEFVFEPEQIDAIIAYLKSLQPE
jgi:mono/diheme cytochrome c family protein